MSTEKIFKDIKLEDADESIFNYFDKYRPIYLKAGEALQKIPIIFAIGERWKILRRKKAIRDDFGKIILPLISLHRTSVERLLEQRGQKNMFNEIIIKKRISEKSSIYANVIKSRKDFGGKCHNTKKNLISGPVFDIYTAPVPDSFKLTYELSAWAQYQWQGNEILESIFGDMFHPIDFKVPGPLGWFYVCETEPVVNSEDNFEEFTDEERIIRQKITFTTTAHVLKNLDVENKGIKKYTSATAVDFDIGNESAMFFTNKEELEAYKRNLNNEFATPEKFKLPGQSDDTKKTIILKNMAGGKYQKEIKDKEGALLDKEKDKLLTSEVLGDIAKHFLNLDS